jgi:predicted LPLAT superfamily acyltransferase
VKQAWIERPEGGTAFGMRLMSALAMFCGRTAARLILYPVALYYLVRRAPERRASRAYLRQVNGTKTRIWHVARHIHTFAAVTLDRAFLLSERFKRFDIRVFGLEELRRVWGLQRGVLVFGSHLGSFDALRVLAQLRSDVKVRVVIDVEQSAAMTKILNSLNPELAKSIINARQEGTTTALAIKEALDERSVVTLLADRARPGNEVTFVDFLGRPAPFPTSPWQLAAALKVPVVLCFGLYLGGNRYDLHFEPFADSLAMPRAERQANLQGVIQRFANRLAHYARLAPYNWFNFYDFWQRNEPSDSAPEAGQGPGPAGPAAGDDRGGRA